MMSLDEVFAQMNIEECLNCNCIEATYDETQEEVIINGSFCYPVEGYQMIQITALNKETGTIVWKKECDTGQTCSIPFSSKMKFTCY